MLSGDVMALPNNYTTTSTGAFTTSQMKSHQIALGKKGVRNDTSIGPSGKFKHSAKTSNLTSQAVNIKHAYGYGGGVLTNSNHSAMSKGFTPISSQKMNSTSVVRQQTQQKTPIT